LNTDQSSNPGIAVGVRVAVFVAFIVGAGDGMDVDIAVGLGAEVGACAEQEVMIKAIKTSRTIHESFAKV